MNIHSTIEAGFQELEQNNLEGVIAVANVLCLHENVTGFWLRGLAKDLTARQQLNRGDENTVAEIKRGFELAIDDYSRVIEAEQTHWFNTALTRRGQLYSALKRYRDAVADLNRVIDREPQNWRARIHRGIAQMHRYKYDAAIEDFDHVLLMRDPSNVQIIESLGRKGEIALWRFKYDEAFFYFESAQQFCEEPMDLVQMKILGSLSLFFNKDYETAADLMQEIEPLMKELDNDNASWHHLQKFEMLQNRLAPELIEQPISEKEIQAARQLLHSAKVAAEKKCKAFVRSLLDVWLPPRLGKIQLSAH